MFKNDADLRTEYKYIIIYFNFDETKVGKAI